jgi:hypothetical protein
MKQAVDGSLNLVSFLCVVAACLLHWRRLALRSF